MRVTGSDIIKEKEKFLVDDIAKALNHDIVRKLFTEKYNLEINGGIEYKQGSFAVRNSDIVYKLDFDVNVPLSVSILCDRNGDCIDIDADNKAVGNIYNGIAKEKIDEKESISSENRKEIEFRDEKKMKIESRNERIVINSLVKPKEKISDMASQIAGMIHEINRN